MIAVITKYYPLRDKFDEVLDCATRLARDETGTRIGCYETRLFASRESGEIKSVSLWENALVFEAYIDLVVTGDQLLEYQAKYMRREIDTQIYETVDTGVIGQLPQDTELDRRHGS